MGYIKCPRCELNYMPDTERYCSVCKREMRGEDEHEEVELCSACGEHPVVPGEELCAACLKELKMQEGEAVVAEAEEDVVVPEEADVGTMDAPGDLEEIDIDVDEDIPSTEYSEIHKELGMDEDEEEEEAEEGAPEADSKKK